MTDTPTCPLCDAALTMASFALRLVPLDGRPPTGSTVVGTSPPHTCSLFALHRAAARAALEAHGHDGATDLDIARDIEEAMLERGLPAHDAGHRLAVVRHVHALLGDALPQLTSEPGAGWRGWWAR